MVVREACPACGSKRFKRNGHLKTGQQNHQCQACGRQFVLHADNRVIRDEQRTLVERLLCEKISLHGICRAVGVSMRWLMGFIAARFAALPDHLHVRPVAAPRDVLIGRLEVEADEMWSFVKKKANKQWVWIAMDKQTRQILAFHVGDRSRESAQQLWANLPAVYREQAIFLKRCTRPVSKPRSYEETMRCRFDPALEPMPAEATHLAPPCCVSTPRSRVVDPDGPTTLLDHRAALFGRPQRTSLTPRSGHLERFPVESSPPLLAEDAYWGEAPCPLAPCTRGSHVTSPSVGALSAFARAICSF